MNEVPPRAHRQFRKIEHRYRGHASQGWYKANLGHLESLLNVPAWVYSTWSPFEVNAVGSTSKEFVTIVDNTYISSFAFNLTKIELGAQLFSDADDYVDLMVANCQKFLAEQSYLINRDGQSMQWIIEYLIDVNERNRALHNRFQMDENARSYLSLAAGIASFSLLLHEIGHFAYKVGSYRARTLERITQHVANIAGTHHRLNRLEEEAFCDIFAIVNAVMTFNSNEGWAPRSLTNMGLHALLGSLLCIKTHEVARMYSVADSTISMAPNQDALMARYEITSEAISFALDEEIFEPKKAYREFVFERDTLDLRACWTKALSMPVRNTETRNTATILANAFSIPELGGFDYVMSRLNSLSRVADVSVLGDGVYMSRRTETPE